MLLEWWTQAGPSSIREERAHRLAYTLESLAQGAEVMH